MWIKTANCDTGFGDTVDRCQLHRSLNRPFNRSRSQRAANLRQGQMPCHQRYPQMIAAKYHHRVAPPLSCKKFRLTEMRISDRR